MYWKRVVSWIAGIAAGSIALVAFGSIDPEGLLRGWNRHSHSLWDVSLVGEALGLDMCATGLTASLVARRLGASVENQGAGTSFAFLGAVPFFVLAPYTALCCALFKEWGHACLQASMFLAAYSIYRCWPKTPPPSYGTSIGSPEEVFRRERIPDIPKSVIVYFHGALSAETWHVVKGTLDILEASGDTRFVFDLEGVRYFNEIESLFVHFADEVKGKGGCVVLSSVHPKVAVIFDMLGLGYFLPRTDTPERAIQVLIEHAREHPGERANP